MGSELTPPASPMRSGGAELNLRWRIMRLCFTSSFSNRTLHFRSLRSDFCHAFTLIELLVVIAVIAVLAAMLLPALNRANLKGMQALCLGNERQLAFGWVMYASDNGDKLMNLEESITNPVPWRYNFTPVPPAPDPDLTTYMMRYEMAGYQQGSMFPYAPNPNVIHCPGDTRSKRQALSNDPATDQYSYGSYSGVDGLNGDGFFGGTLTRGSQLRHSSNLLLFVEENDPRGENLGTWVFRSAPFPYQGGFGDSPAVFHGTTSTFAWCDGHATARKWVDPATVQYAASMNINKYASPPAPTQTPNDGAFINVAYATKVNN